MLQCGRVEIWQLFGLCFVAEQREIPGERLGLSMRVTVCPDRSVRSDGDFMSTQFSDLGGLGPCEHRWVGQSRVALPVVSLASQALS